MRENRIYQVGSSLLLSLLMLCACQASPQPVGTSSLEVKQPEKSFQIQSLVGLPAGFSISVEPEAFQTHSMPGFDIKQQSTPPLLSLPTPGFSIVGILATLTSAKDSGIDTTRSSASFFAASADRDLITNRTYTQFTRTQAAVIDAPSGTAFNHYKTLFIDINFEHNSIGSLDYHQAGSAFAAAEVSYNDASGTGTLYKCDTRTSNASGNLTLTKGPVTRPHQSSVSGTAEIEASFSGGCLNQNGDSLSGSVSYSIPIYFNMQVKCLKQGFPWYYDKLIDVPLEFKVSDNVCEYCPADQIRDTRQDKSDQCVDACPQGFTSYNHGESCVPVPTPPPCSGTTTCGGGPIGGPSGGPSGGPGGGPSGGPGTGPSAPVPGPTGPPPPGPTATPMPTPTPLPTPTPSGGGEDCSNPGYRKLGDECVFCPEEFGLNASKRCHLNLDLKVEHFNQADNDNDAPPVVFSPRDVNGQFDQLNFQVKEQFGRDGGQLVDWTLSVSKKGSTAKLWEKEGKGEEPLPYDGWTDDQGAQDCLRDGEYEVNLVPLKRVFAPSVGRAVVLDNIIVTPEKGEFQVDNTPSVVKDLLVVQNPKNPLPEEEDQVKTTVSFMIKEPLVNQISAGLHPDMYLSSAGTQWLSIDVDDEPLFVDEPFMIASVLPRSYYDIQKVDDRTAVVTFTVDGKAYGRSMVLTMTDALGNTSKQIFWLKAE